MLMQICFFAVAATTILWCVCVCVRVGGGLSTWEGRQKRELSRQREFNQPLVVWFGQKGVVCQLTNGGFLCYVGGCVINLDGRVSQP